ncbi:hypothetical protein, partial [Enterobacter cloacae complex sp. 742-ADZ3-9B]
MKTFLIRFSGAFFVVFVTMVLILMHYLWGESLGWTAPAEKLRVFCAIFSISVFLSLLLITRRTIIAFSSRVNFFKKLSDIQEPKSDLGTYLKSNAAGK